VLVTVPASGSHTLHTAALGDDKQALGVLHTPDVAPAPSTGRPKFAGKALSPADLIGLADGLTFGDLTLEGSDIKLGDEKLATVEEAAPARRTRNSYDTVGLEPS